MGPPARVSRILVVILWKLLQLLAVICLFSDHFPPFKSGALTTREVYSSGSQKIVKMSKCYLLAHLPHLKRYARDPNNISLS